MKVKLFDHLDFDAVGCAIIGKIMFGEDIDIEYHNYDSLHKNLMEFIMVDKDGHAEHEKYDLVYITDIHPEDQTVAAAIDQAIGDKLILLDHHKSADWLNKYKWAHIYTTVDGVTKCGTDLFYEEFLQFNENTQQYEFPLPISKEFIQLVHDLDTWEWEKTGYKKPLQMANLLDIYGINHFIARFYPQVAKGENIELDWYDNFILEIEDEKKQLYIERQRQKLVKKEIDGKKVGVLFSGAYQSEMGNILAKENPDVDYVSMITLNGVSLRTVKDDVDLSVIAKKNGGGGHSKAAGFSISNETRLKMLDLIFGGDKNE